MATFEQGDVVRVPFPYTDSETRQHRPALVVSRGGLGEGGTLLWVLMITSAQNRRWPGDVPLTRGHRSVGLPVPSLVRTTKIATIDARRAYRLGTLSPGVLGRVLEELGRHLGRGAEDGTGDRAGPSHE